MINFVQLVNAESCYQEDGYAGFEGVPGRAQGLNTRSSCQLGNNISFSEYNLGY